jgi:hypothetical protein
VTINVPAKNLNHGSPVALSITKPIFILTSFSAISEMMGRTTERNLISCARLYVRIITGPLPIMTLWKHKRSLLFLFAAAVIMRAL